VRPLGTTRAPLTPDLRWHHDANRRELRKPPRPAGATIVGLPVASVAGALPSPETGPDVPDVKPPELPPLLGQVAAALPHRVVPSAVRTWRFGRNATLAAADWPLFRNFLEAANSRNASFSSAEWEALREFASVAGFDTRPAKENDITSFVRSVSACAERLRRMLRCTPGRLLLTPHPAAWLPFLSGEVYNAYLEDWKNRLRLRPAVSFGRSVKLVNVEGVGPLLSRTPSGPPTAAAYLALKAARRGRGERVRSRRAGNGAVFLRGRTGHGLVPSSAPLAPEMAARCVSLRLLT